MSIRRLAIRDELKQLKKDRILEEAVKLFYERGFRGTSMDAIAESLDMTKPFVYAAFERKTDILVEIYMRALVPSLESVRKAREAGGSAALQLWRFASAYTEVVIHNQRGTAVFFREEVSIPEKSRREINRIKRVMDNEVAALLHEGAAAGEFSLGDVRTTALAIIGMISWAYIWYREGGRLTPAEIACELAANALRMAGASPSVIAQLGAESAASKTKQS
jgi:AcrR family transcriptional regulator